MKLEIILFLIMVGVFTIIMLIESINLCFRFYKSGINNKKEHVQKNKECEEVL